MHSCCALVCGAECFVQPTALYITHTDTDLIQPILRDFLSAMTLDQHATGAACIVKIPRDIYIKKTSNPNNTENCRKIIDHCL